MNAHETFSKTFSIGNISVTKGAYVYFSIDDDNFPGLIFAFHENKNKKLYARVNQFLRSTGPSTLID